MEKVVPIRAEPETITLSGFPPLYEDESIWSACARYADRMGVTRTSAFMREVFGAEGQIWATDLPCGLQVLYETLPPGYGETMDAVIGDHTAYRYYAHFLSSERATRFRSTIETGGGKIRHMIACRRNSLALPEFLRYCPCCAAEERRRVGECYWHRLHQLPGVEVCPVHEVWLESTQELAWYAGGAPPLVAADRVVPHQESRPVPINEPGRDTLFWLARESAWLLTHRVPLQECESFPTRYRYLLAAQGWGTYGKRLAWGPFWRAFLKTHPLCLLKRVEGHSKSLSSGRGIRALLRYPGRATPPLFQLLLIQFLGLTVEEFLHLPSDSERFGPGPWPCLNPIAPHVNELAVVDCRVRIRRRDGKPIGTFACGCGFTYFREGPDWGPLARYTYHGIAEYGLLWEWTFKKLWHDPTVSRPTLAQRCGLSRVTLWKQARRLGFQGGKDVSGSRQSLRFQKEKGHSQNSTRAMRSQWTNLIKKASRSAAEVREYGRLYAWLFRWDYEWLQAHRCLPSGRSTSHTTRPRLNWAARDHLIARAVREAASRLKKQEGRLVRVSKAKLVKESGFSRWIRAYWNRLPDVRRAVDDGKESRDSFQHRRTERRDGVQLLPEADGEGVTHGISRNDGRGWADGLKDAQGELFDV